MNRYMLLTFLVGMISGWFLRGTVELPPVAEERGLAADLVQSPRSEPDRVLSQPKTEVHSHTAFAGTQPINNTMVETAIRFADDDALVQFAASHGILDEDSLLQITDVRSAAQRLADIALRNDLQEQTEQLNHGSSVILFSSQTEFQGGYAVQNIFPANTGNITAIFETGADYGHKVLVKWVREDDNKIIVFRNAAIKSADSQHFVRYHKSLWPAGRYRVEIYAISDQFPLLSRGHYQVMDP
ncbi:hypothetical protein [Pseudoalteromonas ardens]|uniref:Uncharacterized protein n=1 Tax=Pseudoalteromonas rubra TaxID=43658 RepID=A0A0L0ELL3_9GAMM|nr:hypothetical protein [Pseudoalteromonas sp. R96]KNC65347.1 hypothetical protein AC626_23680 [Pseudoalteromonas rubra]MDK1312925.1 hypothetical protein [Pseudoalteromonas sp. R96]